MSAGNGGGVLFRATLGNTTEPGAVYRATVQNGTASVQLLAREGMPALGFPGTPPVENLFMQTGSKAGWAVVGGVAGGETGQYGLWRVSPMARFRQS